MCFRPIATQSRLLNDPPVFRTVNLVRNGDILKSNHRSAYCADTSHQILQTRPPFMMPPKMAQEPIIIMKSRNSFSTTVDNAACMREKTNMIGPAGMAHPVFWTVARENPIVMVLAFVGMDFCAAVLAGLFRHLGWFGDSALGVCFWERRDV